MIKIVKSCKDCPFCCTGGTPEAPQWGCNVSTPALRLVDPEAERPRWCILRNEQYIVREFA
ncbi:MAG: hypothetical protein H0S85_03320 [Desulfovibrionaceae bacterium]|jgi:hypothetical protein|nr:hypothetical protein [Desulfovibrionaceae bacterium]